MKEKDLEEITKLKELVASKFGTPKLTVELMPALCFESNVRSHTTQEDWDRLRFWCYRKEGYTCEICGGVGSEWPVEAHEKWSYIDEYQEQRLDGIWALCPTCHKVKHLGRTYGFEHPRTYRTAVARMLKVNGWTLDDAALYLAYVGSIRSIRDKYPWSLDITWIWQFGITYNHDWRTDNTKIPSKLEV